MTRFPRFVKGSARPKRIIGLMAVIALAMLGTCGLAFLATRPRNVLSRQDVERLALQEIRSSYPGVVTDIQVRPSTLELITRGPLFHCSASRRIQEEINTLLTPGAFNPCDVNAPVWVVEIRGTFTCLSRPFNCVSSTCNRVQIVYATNGYKIRWFCGW